MGSNTGVEVNDDMVVATKQHQTSRKHPGHTEKDPNSSGRSDEGNESDETDEIDESNRSDDNDDETDEDDTESSPDRAVLKATSAASNPPQRAVAETPPDMRPGTPGSDRIATPNSHGSIFPRHSGRVNVKYSSKAAARTGDKLLRTPSLTKDDGNKTEPETEPDSLDDDPLRPSKTGHALTDVNVLDEHGAARKLLKRATHSKLPSRKQNTERNTRDVAQDSEESLDETPPSKQARLSKSARQNDVDQNADAVDKPKTGHVVIDKHDIDMLEPDIEDHRGDDEEEEESEPEELVDVVIPPTEPSTEKTKSTPSSSNPSSVPSNTKPKRFKRTEPSEAPQLSQSSSAYLSKAPSLVLSCTNLSASCRRWLASQNVNVMNTIPSKTTQYICVVREESLPTTVKVLKALLAGKYVVRQRWALDSAKERRLLDLDDYVPRELKERVQSNNRRQLFAGMTLFFTSQAAKSYGADWDEVKEIAIDAGAKVGEGSAQHAARIRPMESVIIMGVDDKEDAHAVTLIKRHSRIVYDKSFLARSIVSAEVDLSSQDVQLALPLGASAGKNRKEKKN